MSDLEQQLRMKLERGEITNIDADAVREFSTFLAEVGPPKGQPGYDPVRMAKAMARYEPDQFAESVVRQLRQLRAERDRYRAAWQSARRRARSHRRDWELWREEFIDIRHERAILLADSRNAQDDLAAILRVLSLGDHARTASPHEVVQGEVLPAIERFQAGREIDQGALRKVITILHAAQKLHQPLAAGDCAAGDEGFCTECCQAWPCGTVRALDGGEA